jgi:hypothetical protein
MPKTTIIDSRTGKPAEVTQLPIRWVPECRTNYGGMDGWTMFIPNVVNGQEIGGIAFDIFVTIDGLLKGMGEPQKFATPDAAKQYAEVTVALKGEET